MNIHEQINELIAALKENTAALKSAAVSSTFSTGLTVIGTSVPMTGPSDIPSTASMAPAPSAEPAPAKKAKKAKVEEAPAAEPAPAPEPAAEASKPGVPEFRAAAQKLLDAGQIAVVRGLKEKFSLSGGASSAVGTEHEDAVWAELQKAIAAIK